MVVKMCDVQAHLEASSLVLGRLVRKLTYSIAKPGGTAASSFELRGD